MKYNFCYPSNKQNSSRQIEKFILKRTFLNSRFWIEFNLKVTKKVSWYVLLYERFNFCFIKIPNENISKWFIFIFWITISCKLFLYKLSKNFKLWWFFWIAFCTVCNSSRLSYVYFCYNMIEHMQSQGLVARPSNQQRQQIKL